MPNVGPNEEDVFAAAVEILSGEDRTKYLQNACGDSADLRRRVEALLRRHDESRGVLDAPMPGLDATVLTSPRLSEGPGSQLGPYKLLQVLGEGGMGTVFMAEQREPVKRRVALKIIKAGMDTQQVINRFEAERQALALMDHPNIARVLDARATDGGRPYFVMELVKGVPLTQYCDEHHLTPALRLELFLPICHAIQHAHQKGIIHRDLKPSNILVAEYDERPVPKIIDFGVAKAVSHTLTEKTMFTQYGQVVGTLEYMSPEQAKLNQLDIDTRSDIYSLGVILYELLTGETPFDQRHLRSAAFDEILRIIREEEPPRPSTRLSTSGSLPSIAANRRTEPGRLSGLVRGELDWIVMKALEKDRTRRYDSAAAFALDIQHFLHDEPVLACPPSAGYRFRKFARRNKAGLATAAAVAVALMAGIVGTTWQAVRATREADRAVEAEQLVAQRYESEKAAREDADRARAAEAVQRQLAEDKTQEAERSATEALAQKEQAATERDRAEAGFAQARRAVNDYFVQVSQDPALAAPDLAELRKELLRSALGFYEEFLKERKEDPALKLELAQSMMKVAEIRRELGENTEAEATFKDALARFRELLQASPKELEARVGEATCLQRLGQYAEAISCWEQLRNERPDDERILQATGDTYNFAAVAFTKDNASEALAMHEKAREIRVRMLEQNPTSNRQLAGLAQTLNNVAMIVHRDPARFQDATLLLGIARTHGERAHLQDPDNFEIARGAAVYCANQGLMLTIAGHYPEAAEAYGRSAEIWQGLAARHPTILDVQKQMVVQHRLTARTYVRLGRTRDATLIMRRLRDAVERQPADSADDLYAVAQTRALCAARLEDDGEGGTWLSEAELEDEAKAAVAALRKSVLRGFRDATALHQDPAFHAIRSRPDFQQLSTQLNQLARLDELQKNPATADVAELEKIRASLSEFPTDSSQDASLLAGVAQTYYAVGAAKLGLGNKADAALQFEQARKICDPLVQQHPETPEYRVLLANTQRRLGSVWWDNQRYVEAKNLWHETRKLLDEGLVKRPAEPTLTRGLALHHYEMAVHFAEYGHWSLAHEHWEQSRRTERFQSALWEGRISALDAMFDSSEEFAQYSQDLINRFGENADSHILWATALRSDSGIPVDRWSRMARETAQSGSGHARGANARVELWTGEVETALPRLFGYLAVIGRARLGQMDDARAKFQAEELLYSNAWASWLTDRADGGLRKFMETKSSRDWVDPKNNYWWEAIGLTIARREAFPLFEGGPAVDTRRHLLEAKIWTRMEEPERAAEALRLAVEATPANPEAWLIRARYLESIGRFDEALADLQRAMELSPDSSRYGAELASFHFRRGDERQAEVELRAADPSPSVLRALGQLLLAQGRPAESVLPLEATLKTRRLSPGLDDSETQNSMFQLARAHFEAGQWNEASLVLEELLAQRVQQFGAESDEAWTVRHNLVCLYQSLPLILEQEFQRDPQVTLTLARRMNNSSPLMGGETAEYNLGLLLYRNGDDAEALQHLDKARGGGGLTVGARLYEAMALWRQGKPDQARQAFAHGFSQSLTQRPAAAYMPVLDEARQLLEIEPEQRFEVARQVLDQPIGNNPSQQFLRVRRGAVHLHQKRFAEALEDFRLAAELSPTDVSAWDGQARVLHAMGSDAEIRPLILNAVAKIEAGLAGDTFQATKTYDAAWHIARIVPEIWDSVDETAVFLEEPTGLLSRNSNIDQSLIKAGWLLREGDSAGYERVCRETAQQWDHSNVHHAYVLARMAALSTTPPLPTTDLVDAARHAVVTKPQNFAQHTLALALLRDGQWHEAIEEAQKATEQNYYPVMNWMIQALAHHHLGHHEVARRMGEYCRIWTAAAAEVGSLHPHDRLGAEFLHREVEHVIFGVGDEPPGSDPSSDGVPQPDRVP